MQVSLTQQVRDKVEETYQKAERIFGRQFRRPKIQFTVKGRTAGRAFLGRDIIDFNYAILNKHGETFISRTPAHEVAHMVAYALYGMEGSGHGPKWRIVMVRLGMRPERCHTYDLEGIVNGHKYICRCKSHIISTNIHNKIMRGQKRTCTKCKTALVPEMQAISFGRPAPTPRVEYRSIVS